MTRRFKTELESLSLEPRHFGVMRAIHASSRPSQQALGDMLQIPASTVVAVVDQLEDKGFARRALDPSDRRVRLVELTEEGREVLERATEVAIRLESAVCSGLTGEEREVLISSLQSLAARMGLAPGVHPAAQEQASEGAEAASPCK
ncbi:MAG TPA: MarR family transcriptional regulator [Acidimicrobiales bacterium]|nr:MarR family transcriptional regulator [Acidimicrobiales bacterium]